MKLTVQHINLHIETDAISDPAPTTAAERIQWVNDAISEVNNRMRKQGITLSAFVEADDITYTGD